MVGSMQDEKANAGTGVGEQKTGGNAIAPIDLVGAAFKQAYRPGVTSTEFYLVLLVVCTLLALAAQAASHSQNPALGEFLASLAAVGYAALRAMHKGDAYQNAICAAEALLPPAAEATISNLTSQISNGAALARNTEFHKNEGVNAAPASGSKGDGTTQPEAISESGLVAAQGQDRATTGLSGKV